MDCFPGPAKDGLAAASAPPGRSGAGPSALRQAAAYSLGGAVGSGACFSVITGCFLNSVALSAM